MNDSSTGPPSLERLLLDCDVRIDVGPLLAALGFEVDFALRVGVDYRRDRDIVRWARENGRILVCHDKFSDRQTRLEVYTELYHNGGKVIRVAGPPGQDPLTIVGKIIVHRNFWIEWFKETDGIVMVHQRGIKYKSSSELYTIVQRQSGLADDPEATIRGRERRAGRRSRQQQDDERQQKLL